MNATHLINAVCKPEEIVVVDRAVFRYVCVYWKMCVSLYV